MDIPAGRAALAGWRALPAATRADVVRLARQGRGHPDPAVARTAVGYGRTWRLRARWAVLVFYLVALLQIPPPNAVRELTSDRVVGAVLAARLAVGVAFLALLIVLAALATRHRRAQPIEIANVRVLLAAEPAVPAPATVHRAGWFVARDWAAVVYLLFVAGVVVALISIGRPPAEQPPPADLPADAVELRGLETALTVGLVVLMVVVGVLGLVVLIMLVAMLSDRPRGTGPVVVLDGGGIALPHLRLTVAWDEVSWLDVGPPEPIDRWGWPVIGLWIFLTDPAAVAARTRPAGLRRRLLRYRMGLHRRAIFLPASYQREPPEIAVGAAWRLLQEHRRRASITG